ncbi:MAG: hypothetical protein OEZ68_01620 [Gammaproteobacteria bacterium]|nr:hypothetical protein [Gammaproteobacteria bacterium]MDH5799478.1 hypothetical protein [Gammaproteobacteria bacterium]
MPLIRLLLLSFLFLYQPASALEVLSARFYPQEHLQLEAQWLEPQLRSSKDRRQENLIIATSSLNELRLTIPAQYLGSIHKIYLVLPKQFEGVRDQGVDIHWETRGRFLAGSAKPGQRVLLFQGLIDTELLWDEIVFTFTIDARYIYGPMAFHPQYEIE